MSDNSKIWQLCLDTLEKQNLPEERKIDKVIMALFLSFFFNPNKTFSTGILTNSSPKSTADASEKTNVII